MGCGNAQYGTSTIPDIETSQVVGETTWDNELTIWDNGYGLYGRTIWDIEQESYSEGCFL